MYGENLKLSVFGESHGAAIGMTMEGVPAGLPVEEARLQQFLNRRAPGQNAWSTPRREEDRPEFLSGVLDGHTTGAPLTAVIYNHNTRSRDYEALRFTPRPGHADYTAFVKYGGFADAAGGGHFSGRLTAPLCVAGGLCKLWLEERGIRVAAHLQSIGGIADDAFDPLHPEIDRVSPDFPVLNPEKGEKMRERIAKVHAEGDSVGGVVECAVTGLPAGLGGPGCEGMESRIASLAFAIPAVKGVSFGAGFAAADRRGSENNDAFAVEGGRVVTVTNHCGGILGSITNAMPLLIHLAVKPTPSIARPQQSVDLRTMQPCPLEIAGRHDPCIAPRAVPVAEAVAAIAVFDTLLGTK